MDYLNNLLVGQSNKLKTVGIVMGSVCVGIIGIISATVISAGIIQYMSSTTSTNDDISPQLSIISTSATNIVSSLRSTISQDEFNNLGAGKGLIYSTDTSYTVIDFSADVTDNAIVQFDVVLSIKPCPGLTIYKIDTITLKYEEYLKEYINGTSGPFTGADYINSTECSFSLLIKDNGRGDEDTVNGTIKDPVLVIYNKSTTTTTPKPATTTTPTTKPTDWCNVELFQENSTHRLNSSCGNGTCVNEALQARCNCTGTGYNGTNCDLNIDDCSPDTCQHGGKCTDGINNYTCACSAGYNGADCETNIDDCSPDTCQHGGKCTDGINSYTCNCTGTGYTDATCQINIDDCSSNPCQNGGSCTDGINNYTCTCNAGYTGVNCQINIDDCSPNPCQNSGTCTDGINNYTCACSAEYIGVNCSDIDIITFNSYAIAASIRPYNKSSALAAYNFIQNVNISNDNVKTLVATANFLCLQGQTTKNYTLIDVAKSHLLLYMNYYPRTNLEYAANNAYGDSSAAATARAAAYAAAYAYNANADADANNPAYNAASDAVMAAFFSAPPGSYDTDAALTCAAGLIYLNVYTLLTQ